MAGTKPFSSRNWACIFPKLYTRIRTSILDVSKIHPVSACIVAPAGYESWGKLYPVWYCTTYQALSGYCVIHSNTLRKYLSIPKRGVKSVVLYISMRYQAVGPVSSNTSRYKKKIQSDSSESQSYLTAPIRQHRQQSNSTNSPTSTVRQQSDSDRQ